jgi:hypothetical protein
VAAPARPVVDPEDPERPGRPRRGGLHQAQDRGAAARQSPPARHARAAGATHREAEIGQGDALDVGPARVGRAEPRDALGEDPTSAGAGAAAEASHG